MKIKSILTRNRNDFTATMECEHCVHIGVNTTGYDDSFYHQRVIPAMRCRVCGKNGAGETEHMDAGVSPVTI